jgi:urease subunit alpha
VHAYHVEGGGGHPDLLSIVSRDNVLTSSTTPTLPLTPSTVAELGPMTLTVHRGHAHVASDAAIASSRIREHAISAENWLHDRGAISIVNSDALGMGRIAETARRTWQLAHVQATLAGETGPDVANNARVLRYLAKLTHNPAVAHGLAAHVGSIRPGRLADIVLWNPAWFGAQPELVIKSGFVAWGAAGSGSGSTRLTQPRRMRAFYGGLGAAPARLAHVFVSQRCLDDAGARAALPPGRQYSPISGSRGLTCADMLHNSATPHVEVAPEPVPVRADGREIPLHRSPTLPLTRLHHLG